MDWIFCEGTSTANYHPEHIPLIGASNSTESAQNDMARNMEMFKCSKSNANCCTKLDELVVVCCFTNLDLPHFNVHLVLSAHLHPSGVPSQP